MASFIRKTITGRNQDVFMIHKSRKIAVTLMAMVFLFIYSGILANRISNLEEQECWNTLEQTAQRTATELKSSAESDRELLESIANILESAGCGCRGVRNAISDAEPKRRARFGSVFLTSFLKGRYAHAGLLLCPCSSAFDARYNKQSDPPQQRFKDADGLPVWTAA